jgi:hypothetical protein
VAFFIRAGDNVRIMGFFRRHEWESPLLEVQETVRQDYTSKVKKLTIGPDSLRQTPSPPPKAQEVPFEQIGADTTLTEIDRG